MEKKYVVGVDYGTQSGRAVIVEADTGKELATSVKEYSHGVMDEYLPDGKTKLEPDFIVSCLIIPVRYSFNAWYLGLLFAMIFTASPRYHIFNF